MTFYFLLNYKILHKLKHNLKK